MKISFIDRKYEIKSNKIDENNSNKIDENNSNQIDENSNQIHKNLITLAIR